MKENKLVFRTYVDSTSTNGEFKLELFKTDESEEQNDSPYMVLSSFEELLRINDLLEEGLEKEIY